MKSLVLFCSVFCMLIPALVFADAPAVVDAGNAINAATSVSLADFLSEIFKAIQGFGGLPWALKIALIVTVIVGAMKMTVLAPMWDKLGAFKAWAAPILGLVLGVLLMGANGSITLAGVFAYMSSGAGAVMLHEFIKTLKSIPGLGAIFVGILDAIEGSLPEKLAKPQTIKVE